MQTPFELLVVAVNNQYKLCKDGSKPDKELHELTVKLLERINKDLYAENTYELSTGVEARMEDLEDYMDNLFDEVDDEKEEKDDVEEIDFSEEDDEEDSKS